MNPTVDTPDASDPPSPTAAAAPGRKLSLSAQVFIGLGLGLLAGLFFGEVIAPVVVVGEIFVGLLQMTVLPYILVSLITSVGRLSYDEIRILAARGGRFILLFWAIALIATLAFTMAMPNWTSAAFFSSSLVESGPPADLVALYIPANPFFSLSSSVVPAIVVFSLALGLAVIGVPEKERFLDNLDVLGEAIMRIAGFVARLAPIGVFALIASAAGTLEIEALGRLQVFIITYIGLALLLSLWVLPMLVGVLTPIRPKRLISACQDALVTAFATGSLLIVLPLISERLKELLAELDLAGQEAESAVDLVIPINFNLPNLGKLMSLAFVPFAAWFAGSALDLDQYPLFLVSGLFSFFGEVVVALPFLLDLMHIPADMFQLFLAVDIFTGRFGAMLAGAHTIVLALLTAASVGGRTRIHWPSLLRYVVISLSLAVAVIVGLRYFFEVVVPQEYREYEKLVGMDLQMHRVESRKILLDAARPDPEGSDGTRLSAIREREALRVGYAKDGLPFVYRNEDGELVGLEVDLVHQLAREMEVRLEFVEVPPAELGQRLNEGRIDLAIGGLLLTPERALAMRFTVPYLSSTLALIVPDHARSRFNSIEKLRGMNRLRIAVPNMPYYSKFIKRHLPQAELVTIDSPRAFFRAPSDYDALLDTAEAGSAWTLVYPEFSVVVPKPDTISVPGAIGMPLNAPRLAAYVDTWLQLQRDSGLIGKLRSYWILGEGANRKGPRWSVARNVLGWLD